jgi:hypothetical protein
VGSTLRYSRMREKEQMSAKSTPAGKHSRQRMFHAACWVHTSRSERGTFVHPLASFFICWFRNLSFGRLLSQK